MSCLDYLRHGTKRRLIAGEHVHWVDCKRGNYIRQAVLSFPFWIKRADFKEIEEKRDFMTKATGIQHSFDHIIPLNHPRVCGLSVPWNFQILSKFHNDSKGNAWCEWHGELFTEPEQLRMF
jgi:5-methylcytosine-specific restriction endonuclease McrA